MSSSAVEADEAEQPEAGPSSQPASGRRAGTRKLSTRRNINRPRPSRIITLTETSKAPPRLALQYNVCIPCREAISRCDGHKYFTQACTQCKSRGTKCTWALARGRGRAQGSEDDEPTSNLDNSETDTQAAASTSASEADTRERDEQTSIRQKEARGREKGRHKKSSDLSTQAKRLRFRFPQTELDKKGPLRSRPIPSAGWETIKTAISSQSTVDVKGKGKSHTNDEAADRRGPASSGTQTEVSSSEEDNDGGETKPDTGHSEGKDSHDYQAILSQLNNTAHGREYIQSDNYTALLRSVFAEESSDLSRSLYWWEFSESAKSIRAKWPSLLFIDKKEWRAMSFLDMLLAENTYSWSLWPRPPHARDPQVKNADTLYPPASSDDSRFLSSLPEAIISTALSVLSKSSLPDEIIKSMTPMHIRAWTQTKRDYSFPATISTGVDWRSTIFGKSKYSIPPSSEEAFVARYLNRDELVLDIVEDLGPPTAAVVQHALDSVLLKVASLRDKKGMRKPPRDKKDDSEKVKGRKSSTAKKAAGKGNAKVASKARDKGKGKERARDQDMQDNTTEAGTRDTTADADFGTHTAANSDAGEGSDQGEVANDKGKKGKRKAGLAPVDWQKILLAAIMVPGLPRSAIEATVSRVQGLYGPSSIDFLSRWDAIHSRVDLPSTASTSFFTKLPLPPLPRKREASAEPSESRQADKTLKRSDDTVSNEPPVGTASVQPENVAESSTDMYVD